MVFSINQLIYIFINVGIIGLGVGLTFLAIKMLGLKEKSTRLLFVFYIVYWLAPLLTRDYTGLIQVHFNINLNAEWLLMVPILAYGLIGIFYRPLSDWFSLKMKSRKKVLYISLGLQLCCVIPMFCYPCLATNIIQSIGAGIGAGCIGLFNLMFNEHDLKAKAGHTAVVLVLPPLLAQFFASACVSIVVSFVKNGRTGDAYVDHILHLWIFAMVAIIAAIIISIFVKEKQETLYKKDVVKEVVKGNKEKWFFALMCLCAMFISATKWMVTGATASIEIAYLAKQFSMDTRAFEGYASLILSYGQLLGVMAATIFINKTNFKHKKLYCLCFATLVGVIYGLVNMFFVNIPTFTATGCLAGFAYGIFTNIILRRIIRTIFASKNPVLTPVGVYNSSLAVGIVFGSFINIYIKVDIFAQITGFTTFTFHDFKLYNGHVEIIYMTFMAFALICYLIGRQIKYKTKNVKKVTIRKEYVSTGDTEM